MRAFLVAGAAAAGVGLAASLPAPAAGQQSPVLEMWPVPAAMDPSGTGALADAALAPAADAAGEEVIVSSPSGGAMALEVSPTGEFSASSTQGQLGSAPFVAMVKASSLDWALSGTGVYANGGPGTAPRQFPVPGGSFTDMALGLDGHLYLADNNGNIDRCEISSAPSSTCGIPYPVGSAFASPQPEAVAAAGAQVWFTTASEELGWVSSAGTQGGPYDETTDNLGNSVGPASSLPHSLTLGANGYLFVIGSPTDPNTGVTTPNSTILEIDPRVGPRITTTGNIVNTYNLGLPAGATLSSLTSGPDGDLWFTEETASGPNAVGQLDPTTGTVTSYPLPSGYTLQAPGGEAIEPGPVGTGTVWFAAESTGSPNEPAIGEITNVGGTGPGQATSAPATSSTATSTPTTSTPTTTSAPPATTTTATTKPPARLSVSTTAKVSRRGVASVGLRCAGVNGQTCSGVLALTATGWRTVLVQTRGHRHSRRHRVTLTLGSAHYGVQAMRSVSLAVRLSSRALAMLASAPARRLKVTAASTPANGSTTTVALTLTG